MSLALFLGLIFGLIFTLPVIQQGAGLVVVIFSLATLIRFVSGAFGYV